MVFHYYKEENLAELQAKPTTRAQDIMAEVPGYWQHYREQAAPPSPRLEAERSRGRIYELELAIDAIDAIFNDRKEILPVNMPNQGAIADFPDDLVVEVPAYFDKNGAVPLAQGYMPLNVIGIITKRLPEGLALAGELSGTRGG